MNISIQDTGTHFISNRVLRSTSNYEFEDEFCCRLIFFQMFMYNCNPENDKTSVKKKKKMTTPQTQGLIFCEFTGC